jgi:hypothetical protein
MITMRPGYETLDYRSLPYRHAKEMRHPQWITERLANGWTRQALIDGADLPAGWRSSSVPDGLQRALDSGDPGLALRARQLQLLMLAAG